jgi:glycosyltransferase involved in cell wall biosynthesis
MANCVRQSALLSAASVRVIHTGVDVSLYRPFDRRAAREILRLPQEARIVLTCADDFRADGDRKGSAYVLDAMFRVMERVPNAYLAVFGSARKPEGIPSTAFGAVRDERLLALIYAAADIFVSTALEDNLPNTVLEALSSGLPVVGFGIGGLLDAVRDEHTGYLSPPRDMEALAGQISRCLLDDEGRQMKSRNARESALALFDARASGTEYAALFRDLCGAR